MQITNNRNTEVPAGSCHFRTSPLLPCGAKIPLTGIEMNWRSKVKSEQSDKVWAKRFDYIQFIFGKLTLYEMTNVKGAVSGAQTSSIMQLDRASCTSSFWFGSPVTVRFISALCSASFPATAWSCFLLKKLWQTHCTIHEQQQTADRSS